MGVGNVYEANTFLGLISIRAFKILVGAATSRRAAGERCLRASQGQLKLTKITI